MPISVELSEKLEDASTALLKHQDGELILPIRKKIWASLGPRQIEGTYAIFGIGLYRRTTLAKLCVQKVLKLWEQDWPDHTGPHVMLSTVEKYLRKQLDFKAVWGRKNLFWGELETLLYQMRGSKTSINVGFAAANVVTMALNDERFNSENLKAEEQFLDEDYDPYEWDTSFYASIAYAKGAPGDEDSNLQQRQEFWEWYLKEAVPAAWEVSEYS
jgi:hypothetical protein